MTLRPVPGAESFLRRKFKGDAKIRFDSVNTMAGGFMIKRFAVLLLAVTGIAAGGPLHAEDEVGNGIYAQIGIGPTFFGSDKSGLRRIGISKAHGAPWAMSGTG